MVVGDLVPEPEHEHGGQHGAERGSPERVRPEPASQRAEGDGNGQEREERDEDRDAVPGPDLRRDEQRDDGRDPADRSDQEGEQGRCGRVPDDRRPSSRRPADEDDEADDQQPDEPRRRDRPERHRLGADRGRRLVLGREPRERLEPMQVDRKHEIAQLEREDLGLARMAFGPWIDAVLPAVGDARAQVHEHHREDERQADRATDDRGPPDPGDERDQDRACEEEQP